MQGRSFNVLYACSYSTFPLCSWTTLIEIAVYENLTCHGQAPGFAFTPPITKTDFANMTCPQFPATGNEVGVGMGTKNSKRFLLMKILSKNYMHNIHIWT